MNCLAFIERKCPKIQETFIYVYNKVFKVDIFSAATLCERSSKSEDFAQLVLFHIN
jgi:hypothetical protein